MTRLAILLLLLFNSACSQRIAVTFSGDSQGSDAVWKTNNHAGPLATAITNFERNRYGAAMRECDVAIEASPQNAQAHLLRGIVYCVTDDIQRGVDDFDTALGMNPQYTKRPNERDRQSGAADRVWIMYDTIIRSLDAVSILKPRYASAFTSKGQAHFRDQDHAAAIRCFDEALVLNPVHTRALSARGTAHLDQGRFDQAFADYREAVRLQPGLAAGFSDACMRRGLAERAAGNESVAGECLAVAAEFRR